jgi:hypothetical protein
MYAASSLSVIQPTLSQLNGFMTQVSLSTQFFASSPTPTSTHQKQQLTTAKKVGIILGVLIPIALGLLIAIIMYVRKNNREWNGGMQQSSLFKPPIQRILPEKATDNQAEAAEPIPDQIAADDVLDLVTKDGEKRNVTQDTLPANEQIQEDISSSNESLQVPQEKPPNYFLFSQNNKD